MKKQAYHFSFLFALLFVVSSCNLDECANKDYFLKNFEEFIATTSENYKSFSTEEWKLKDEKMDKYVKECYETHEDKLSEDEKKEFWVKTVKYYYKRYGFNLTQLLNGKDDELSKLINEKLDVLKEFSEEDFEKMVKDIFGDDVNSLIDDLVKSVEEIGEEIKENLKEK